MSEIKKLAEAMDRLSTAQVTEEPGDESGIPPEVIENGHDIAEMKEQIKELAQMAYSLVPDEGNMKERAKRYWYAQIIMALDNDHGWMGSGSHTMEDTVNEMTGNEPEDY